MYHKLDILLDPVVLPSFAVEIAGHCRLLLVVEEAASADQDTWVIAVADAY